MAAIYCYFMVQKKHLSTKALKMNEMHTYLQCSRILTLTHYFFESKDLSSDGLVM